MSTQDIIDEYTDKMEINTLNWVLKLIDKFPIELAISEIKKYKAERENG